MDAFELTKNKADNVIVEQDGHKLHLRDVNRARILTIDFEHNELGGRFVVDVAETVDLLQRDGLLV